jgi:hypothetical protein
MTSPSGVLGRIFWAAVGLFVCAALWAGPVDALSRTSMAPLAKGGAVVTPGPRPATVDGSAAATFRPGGPASQVVPAPARGIPVSGPTPADVAGSAAADLASAAHADAQTIIVVVPPHEVPTTTPKPVPTTTPGGESASNGTANGATNGTAGSVPGGLGALPRTGLDGLTLRLLLVALVLLDIGWLLHSLAKRRRRP